MYKFNVELRKYIICKYPGMLHVAPAIWPCAHLLVLSLSDSSHSRTYQQRRGVVPHTVHFLTVLNSIISNNKKQVKQVVLSIKVKVINTTI